MAKRVKVEVVDRDLGWNEWFKRVREIRSMRIKVGVLADSARGGLHVEGSDLTVAEIAAVNEFGTEDGHVPERSFVRATFDAKLQELKTLGEKLIGQTLDGKMSVAQALGLMGAWLVAETKKTITSGSGVPPPNAPATIERKGSSRPLVDTGRLLQAITWAISRRDEE